MISFSFDPLGLAGALERLAIMFATSKYIEAAGATPALQLARAQSLKDLVTELQGLAVGTVTVAQLQTLTAADIAKQNLSPSAQMLATGLLNIVISDLTIKAGAGILQAQAAAAVEQIAEDISAACLVYGAK